MILDLRRKFYQRYILALVGASLIGWYFNETWMAIAITTFTFTLWNLIQQDRLITWLKKGGRGLPPESSGAWGIVFDLLYRLQRENKQQLYQYRGMFKRIRTSTEALNDGIVLLTEQGNLEWWNTAAGNMLQLRQQDAGQLLTNLLREPQFIKYYNRKKHSEPLTIANPSDPDSFLQVAMTVFGRGERLLIIRDITRLIQLEQMRQDFVANASHELKTPLTVLKGNLENIIAFSTDLPAPIQKALNSMEQHTSRMTNLVNDLLLLTRLDSDNSSAGDREIDVDDLLQQVVSDAADLSGDNLHQLTLDCQPGITLLGHPGEIRSAINNLVFNAVNYSPAHSTIQVSWKFNGQKAILSVTDEGLGIDQHHIPRLTERFYRIDAGRSSEKGGTGLGLAIVKHALQRHEARLDIRSKKNLGSTFSCVFPKSRIVDRYQQQNTEQDDAEHAS